jgi:ribosomal protein S18 acetylase RimI-like enzyme
MDAVTFAPMAPDEFALVAALGDRIWRQHYAEIVSMAQIEYMLAGRYTDAKLAAYLGADDRWLMIVRDGGLPIGYFSWARVDAHEVKLEQLYLIAATRGRGLGGRMIAHVEAHARGLGCDRLMLTVNKRNAGAIAVYERRGFTVREEAVFDIGQGYVMDDYVMAKAI